MDSIDQEILRAMETSDGDSLPSQSPDKVRSPARILFVSPHDAQLQALIADVESQGHLCVAVERVDQAMQLIESDRFELLFIGVGLANTCDVLKQRMAEVIPAAKVLMFATAPTAEETILAMRSGAVDFLRTPVEAHELRERVNAALDQSRLDQRRENRMQRLKVICQELNNARKEIADQLDLICREMVSSHEGLHEQMNEVAMASEFRTLVQQELDVEDMLRTSLEYLLTKTGPTNAAVFLGNDEGRFSLGAYVNYDCPRDTITQVLEHLGEAICPQMEEEAEIISFEDARAFAQWLDVHMGMPAEGETAVTGFAESQVIAFSCFHEGECLAMVVLFRNRTKPFEDSLVSVIETLRPIFAAQLANVAKVHDRSLPSWPEEAIGEDDEYDGYGYAA